MATQFPADLESVRTRTGMRSPRAYALMGINLVDFGPFPHAHAYAHALGCELSELSAYFFAFRGSSAGFA